MSSSMSPEDLYLERERDRFLQRQPLCVTVEVSRFDLERLVALAKKLGRTPEPNEDPKVAARYAAAYLLKMGLYDLERLVRKESKQT